ncbi:ferrous iron transport protein A [Streptomyces sp. NPDC050610]|uniref:ferrous iron transport protein A n=1 Tax=Streptomyces sp. NPDC050610 TaxID=3157097 RepID=UPI003433FAD9
MDTTTTSGRARGETGWQQVRDDERVCPELPEAAYAGPNWSGSGDRRAVEHILGRPLSDEWPPGSMPPGTRVTVIRDSSWNGPWQKEFQGTIDDLGAPEPAQQANAREGELVYWVTFDEPQHESSGDGPYRKAQIWERYLRREPQG